MNAFRSGGLYHMRLSLDESRKSKARLLDAAKSYDISSTLQRNRHSSGNCCSNNDNLKAYADDSNW